MTNAVYIAELAEQDYAQFRDKDASLPAKHSGWARRTVRRMQRLRRDAVQPILVSIDFDGFLSWATSLDCGAYGEDARDRYAERFATGSP